MNILRKIYRRAIMTLTLVRIPKGKRAIRHVKIQGFEMLVPANEDVGRIIYLFGDFEPEETTFFRTQIKPGDVCLDIGGNVGYFSLLMAQCANQGQVHVFEPIPMNAALIRTNAELNNFDNIIVNNVALADQEGEADFSISVDSAYSSLHATGRMAEARNIRVPLWTLDTYLARNEVGKIALLKADVEGAEELVLKGATALLADPARRPDLIMLELYDVNLAPFNSSVQAIVAFMEGVGYQPKVLANGKSLTPYQPEMANQHHNIFFTI